MKLRKAYLVNSQKHGFDFTLITIVGFLVVLGLIVVYDASVIQAYHDFGDPYYYIRQQLIWIVLGLLGTIFFSQINYRSLKRFAWPVFLVSIGLLMTVFIPGFGNSVGGAQRWLNLGFVTIQPAEVFKLASVLWLATLFEKRTKLRLLVILLGVAITILGILQKDLGSAIVFGLTCLIIYIIAGGQLWKLSLTLPLGLLGFIFLILSSEYRRKRVLAFLDPFSDTQGFSYHISQVLIALGSGGWFGLGLGQSRQKFYIPEVTTDSIFAIIGEELGLAGSAFVIFLFCALIFKGLTIAQNAPDNFGKILATGLVSWLGVQAIVNIGAMASLFPLTGVPLPFISYGGSALVANLAAVGILLNISRYS